MTEKLYDVWARGVLIKKAVTAEEAEIIIIDNIASSNCSGVYWESPSDPALLYFEETDGDYYAEVVPYGELPIAAK